MKSTLIKMKVEMNLQWFKKKKQKKTQQNNRLNS